MIGTTFDPIDALGARQGGRKVWKKSPKIRFSVFKPKLWEIRLQKLIIICWYGYCGYSDVGFGPEMGGGAPPGAPRRALIVEKSRLLVINGCKSS